MNCSRVREVLFLYADEEMEAELLVDFQRHLVLCPRCARRADYTMRVLAILRQRCAKAPAPQRLRARILLSLPHRNTERGGGWEPNR